MMVSGKVSPVLKEKTLQRVLLENPFEKHPRTSESSNSQCGQGGLVRR